MVSSLVEEIYRADFTCIKIIGRDTNPLKAKTIKQNLGEKQNKQPLKIKNIQYISEKKGIIRSRERRKLEKIKLYNNKFTYRWSIFLFIERKLPISTDWPFNLALFLARDEYLFHNQRNFTQFLWLKGCKKFCFLLTSSSQLLIVRLMNSRFSKHFVINSYIQL